MPYSRKGLKIQEIAPAQKHRENKRFQRIFQRIRKRFQGRYDEETEVADKITAIQEELDAERHTAVSKEHLIEVLRWLIEEYI